MDFTVSRMYPARNGVPFSIRKDCNSDTDFTNLQPHRTMKITHLWIGILLVYSLLACRNSTDEIETRLLHELETTNCVLGETYAVWTNALGLPLTIEQKDGGNTFFNWPAKGVAVFCHPLFKGQYNRKEMSNWKITSILIPLVPKVNPGLPPVDGDLLISFTRLLIEPEEVELRRWANLKNVFELRRNGRLEALELRKPDSIMGDYD